MYWRRKGLSRDAGLFANVYTGVAKTRKRAVAEGVLARVRDADLTQVSQTGLLP